ncbi:MAG: hypothetical protein PHU25_17540 [Deltaproteobacteria bacterium]|nr:hypothetical protein [Deltaproteobacteria bacterium]
MSQSKALARVEKGFKFLSGLALALFLFQVTGVLTYVLTAWPPAGGKPSTGIVVLVCAAVAAGLARSTLWVRIYWTGAKVASTLRSHGEKAELPDLLVPLLARLTRLLVASCVLDVLLLPSIFLMDAFFPFTLSSVHLGMIQLASMLLPQAFGLAALILAYLTHQYGQLMRERCRMKTDLELTI